MKEKSISYKLTNMSNWELLDKAGLSLHEYHKLFDTGWALRRVLNVRRQFLIYSSPSQIELCQSEGFKKKLFY